MTTGTKDEITTDHPIHPFSAELPVHQLFHPCDPEALSFATTNELPDLRDSIGQPRALRALELGSEVHGPGYNIFVLGIPDSGRTTLTRDYLQRKAALGLIPEDWCYVNNFDNPRQPHALHLPPGLAIELRKGLRQLVTECRLNVPRAFSSEEYSHERDQLVNAMKDKLEHELSQLENYVKHYNFILIKTP